MLKDEGLINLSFKKSEARLKSSHINDQVYSLLGLAPDAAELVPNPDYKLCFRTVMKELYQTIISKTPSLDWICLSGSNETFDPGASGPKSLTNGIQEVATIS